MNSRRIRAISCLSAFTCFICMCSLLVMIIWVASERSSGFMAAEDLAVSSSWSTLAEHPNLLLGLGFLGGLGVLSLAVGSALQGQMSPVLGFVWRHAVAVLSTTVTYTLLSLWVAVLAWRIESSDVPLFGIGMTTMSLMRFLPKAVAISAIGLLPISLVLEMLLIGKLKWRWWGHIPAAAVIFWGLWAVVIFLVLPPLEVPVTTAPVGTAFPLVERARLSFVAGFPMALLFGVVYWLSLRVTTILLHLVFDGGERGKTPSRTGWAVPIAGGLGLFLALSLTVLMCGLVYVFADVGWGELKDKEAMFEKIFWREKPDTVVVSNIEFHENRSVFGSVEAWQWFIEFESTDEFTEWIIDSEFGLIKQGSGANFFPSDWVYTKPTWFEPGEAFELWRTRDGRMSMYLEKNGNRVFMTDWDIQ
jgi:hypothetical protein